MTTPPHFSAGPQSPPHEMRARPSSSPAELLRQLEKRKLRVHAEFAKLDRAYADGKVSREEYWYYLHKVHGGKQEHQLIQELEAEQRRLRDQIEAARTGSTKSPAIAAAILIVMLGAFAWLLLQPFDAGPTGLVTLPTEEVAEPVDYLFTANGSIPLNLSNTSSFKVSGSLSDGAASLYLTDGVERLLVWSGEARPTAAVSTDKESYARNATINVTVLPEDAAYTLWLTDPIGEKRVVTDGFAVETPGLYTLDALLNSSGNITKLTTTFTVRNETNSSNDVAREIAPAAHLSFEDACAETCAINMSEASLSLEVLVSDGATLALTEMITSEPRDNTPPAEVIPIPDIFLSEGESTTINLSLHFTDPDGDSLAYDYMNAAGVEMSVGGNLLTITGLAAGESESRIYASDLYELVESDPFTITVTPGENLDNTTNATTEVPLTNGSVVNETANQTSNETEEVLDCSNTDPNLRPIECLQEESPKYFPGNELYLTTNSRQPIARITPIGNLLLTGRAYELADFEADMRDYVIGYEDAYGDFQATIWFDSESGNLYLKGSLYEENANNVPPPGAFALRNRKGITLAWASKGAGDLYLRGNLIPYRTSITE